MRRVLALVLALRVHAALPAPGARPETGRTPRRPAEAAPGLGAREGTKVLGFIAVGLGLLVLSLALQNGARIMLRNCGIFSIMLGVAKMVTLF